MKKFAAILLAILPLLPAAADEPSVLERDWNRYNEIFRPPSEILFEIQTELEDPDHPLRLARAADLLRSIPNVEEAFATIPCIQLEQEQMVIFQMLNAPPAEFGAWLEKLQPRHVREGFRKFVQWSATQRWRDPCAVPDPLRLKCFYTIPGTTPVFKQPIQIGLFVRLKPRPGASSWDWKLEADHVEAQIRGFYEKSGWNVQITRIQYLPPSEPGLRTQIGMAGLMLLVFWGLVAYWRDAPPGAFLAAWPGFLARRRKWLILILLLGLAVPLVRQKIPKPDASGCPRRPAAEGAWTLKSDHGWQDRTACLLVEGGDWGEVVYQLGAQRFAFTHARDDKLVTRYWSPADWVPRPVYQRANAADFLKKRNAVVMEKIARQEKLEPRDFAPTVDFLNRVGQVSLMLTQSEESEWILSRDPNALGLRFRHWIRSQDQTMAAVSYTFVAPETSEQELMPWVAKAVASFGVEPRWIVPELLFQEAVRRMLAQMGAVGAAVLAAFLILARGRSLRLARAAAATFLCLASWLLSLVALDWEWNGGGLWIWAAVAVWHASLGLELFRQPFKHAGDPAGAFAAATSAGAIVLAATWAWSASGTSEGWAVVLATGLFWSLAWSLVLAPSGARHSKFNIQDSKSADR